MGYGVSEVYGLSPLSQLEKGPYVWDIKGYGLWQVWVIRSSTVYPKYGLGDVDLNVPFCCCAKMPDEHMHIKPIVPPYDDTW